MQNSVVTASSFIASWLPVGGRPGRPRQLRPVARASARIFPCISRSESRRETVDKLLDAGPGPVGNRPRRPSDRRRRARRIAPARCGWRGAGRRRCERRSPRRWSTRVGAEIRPRRWRTSVSRDASSTPLKAPGLDAASPPTRLSPEDRQTGLRATGKWHVRTSRCRQDHPRLRRAAAATCHTDWPSARADSWGVALPFANEANRMRPATRSRRSAAILMHAGPPSDAPNSTTRWLPAASSTAPMSCAVASTLGVNPTQSDSPTPRRSSRMRRPTLARADSNARHRGRIRREQSAAGRCRVGVSDAFSGG